MQLLISTWYSKTLTVTIQALQVDLSLIRLVDMGFNMVFSDPHSKYTGLTGGSGFNYIGAHWFQSDVLRPSL